MRGLILLGLVVGCTGTAPEPSASTAGAASQPASQSEHAGHHGEHAGHAGHHAEHAGHHPPDGATADHRFQDAERWSRVFDDPARDAWQKPAELVAAVGIEPGMVVADIGAGTGYLGEHLRRAVGEEGRVILADVEPELVAHMRERFAGQSNVQARTIPTTDPGLEPAEVDAVILLDVAHHISGRVAWFTELRTAVRPGGRVIIVDFKPGELPVGPPPEHRLAAEQLERELGQAGWTLTSSPDVLPHQYVQIYSRAE